MNSRSRVESRARNRDSILAAAREEFAKRGYRAAKIDGIAARAGLTRGAVYSNFPGKRELYLAAMAESSAPPAEEAAESTTLRQALGALARSRLARLPLTMDDAADRPDPGHVARLLTEPDERLAYAQLLALETALLGLAWEGLPGRRATGDRLVRVAGMALTILRGAEHTAAESPGLSEPFDVVNSCENLADLDTDDWAPPPDPPPVRAVDTPLSSPTVVDALDDHQYDPSGDGVVGFFGLHRLSTVEHMVRAARDPVTVVLVTGKAERFGPLVRLVLSRLAEALRATVPHGARPNVSVVFDDSQRLSEAAGLTAVSDDTETAMRVVSGRITARAEGFGAGHAIAASLSRHPR